MMLGDPEIPQRAHRTLMRMQHAGRDMEAIIDAFLILARENEHAPLTEDFDVPPLVEEEVEKVRPLLAVKPVELELVVAARPPPPASPPVPSVLPAQAMAPPRP